MIKDAQTDVPSFAEIRDDLRKRPALAPLSVLVRFGSDVPLDAQGKALLMLEKLLRELTGSDIEVFKDTMGDDSKLRRMMTQEQRDKL